MALPSRGRPGLVLMMTTERELTQTDLIDLELNPGEIKLTSQPILQRLRASHHTAARLLAEGRRASEVAIIVNRTPQNIRDLQRNDPAFQGLIKYYQDQLEEIGMEDSVRIQSKLRLLAEQSTDELIDRFDDDAKRSRISTETIQRVAAMALDRTVAPPKTAISNTVVPAKITFNIGSKDIRPTSTSTPESTITIEHEESPNAPESNEDG